MNAPLVNFNITDLSFSAGSILSGISCVSGITLRGPFAKPDLLMSTWEQFTKLYGGYIANSDFPLLCKRAFDMGSQLRINRQGHYATITSAASLDAVKASKVPAKILTFSAALIASNVYNLTINGTGISPVTFATDSDTTMAAIATAIKAVTAYVSDAFVVPIAASVSNDRVILIIQKATTLTLTASAVTAGSSQATVTITATSNVTDANAIDMFGLAPKYQGQDYNNLTTVISAASNGNAAYFNMDIIHSLDSSLNESYQNLTITGNPTINNSHYLDAVKVASQVMDFTYLDLSATTGQQRPVNGTYYFNSGSDGTTPAVADYVGDPAGQNGFHSFDSIDDSLQFGAPELSDNTLHVGGSAYAGARKDIIYFAHLDNANSTAASYISARGTTNVDSYFTAFFGGGLSITDPVTGLPKNISELGDVFGIMAVNDSFGPWKSPAGVNRGIISNALGVVNNYGPNAKYADLNSMANRQINMVVNKDNQIYLNGNMSAQLANSKLSFLNTIRFLIWFQRTIGPVAKKYMQEPGDIPTFKALFREVEPTLLDLVTADAISQFAWKGDQDAKDLDSMVINNPTDVDNGKYKVRVFLKTVSPITTISFDLVVTATNVSLENIQ